jgi:hypothetical protein
LNICMLLLREIRHMWLSVRLMWRDVWRYWTNLIVMFWLRTVC